MGLGVGGLRRLLSGTLSRSMPLAHAQVLAVEGVEEHGFQRAEGIVADLDPVATQPRIDLEEEPVQLHVGEVRVDLAALARRKYLSTSWRLTCRVKRLSLVVAIPGRLAGFAVGLLVVALLQPGGQGVVEPVEGEDLAGADLAFQLAFGRSRRSVRSVRRAADRPRRGGSGGCSRRSRPPSRHGRDRSWRCPGTVRGWPRGPTRPAAGSR